MEVLRGTIKSQHLIERSLVRDKPILEQTGTRRGQRSGIHSQTFAQGRFGVIAEALAISHGDEKEIQCRSLMAYQLNVVITDQTVIHPTELLRNAADAVGTNGELVGHNGLLWLNR